MFCRYGCPKYLKSDLGRQFIASLLQNVLELLNIDKINALPYCPQGQSVERANQSVYKVMSGLINPNLTNWHEQLCLVERAMNTTLSDSTGTTPFQIYTVQI